MLPLTCLGFLFDGPRDEVDSESVLVLMIHRLTCNIQSQVNAADLAFHKMQSQQ